MAMLESVVAHAPYIQVIVADDLSEDYTTQITNIKGFDHEPIYMKLPHDSGISYGRNRLVRMIL